MFLESGESSKLESTLRWTIFNLNWLSGASELSKQYIERWQNPMIATRELFAVRMAGSDGAMRPLIDDGDIVIVLRGVVPPFSSNRIVVGPVLLSREGKVLARLAGVEPSGRVSIGSVDRATPPGIVRMAAPEQTLAPSADLFRLAASANIRPHHFGVRPFVAGHRYLIMSKSDMMMTTTGASE